MVGDKELVDGMSSAALSTIVPQCEGKATGEGEDPWASEQEGSLWFSGLPAISATKPQRKDNESLLKHCPEEFRDIAIPTQDLSMVGEQGPGPGAKNSAELIPADPIVPQCASKDTNLCCGSNSSTGAQEVDEQGPGPGTKVNKKVEGAAALSAAGSFTAPIGPTNVSALYELCCPWMLCHCANSSSVAVRFLISLTISCVMSAGGVMLSPIEAKENRPTVLPEAMSPTISTLRIG